MWDDLSLKTPEELQAQAEAIKAEFARRERNQREAETKNARENYGVLTVCDHCDGTGEKYIDHDGCHMECEVCDGDGCIYRVRYDAFGAARRDFDCLQTCIELMNEEV